MPIRVKIRSAAAQVLGLLCLVFAALPAAAQSTQTVGVYFDVDDDAGTGCDAQGFSGAEVRLTVTLSVVNAPPSATVSGMEYQDCVDPGTDTFGAPVAPSSNGIPPWPVGVGQGVDGSDVIEAYVPRTVFPDAAGLIRAGVFSGDAPGDTMYVTLGGGSDPILISLGQVIPIPTLSEWMLLALALFLVASAFLVLRRRPARMAFLIVFLALTLTAGAAGVAWAACVMDGMVDDWAGASPLAQDPTSDAVGQTPDLRAFFAMEDGDVVCLRIDAFVAFNTPPSITDIVDQTIPEDGATGALAFVVGDLEDAATDLVVTATSSNQMLVPNGNISFSGSGANRTVMVTPVANGNGFTDVTVTVTDTAGASSSTTFRVTVTSENDAPSISSINDQGILEDSNTGPLAFTVDDTETAAGSLTLTGSSSDISIIPDGNIVFGGSGMNRTVTVTPAADANGGPVTITVTVMDGDGGSVPTQFDVTVTPVNDEPVLVLGSDQTVDEDSGAQSVPGFATPSVGPANEAGQTLSLDVTNDNNALFAVQPDIDPNTGELTYTPAADTFGSATVTVVAMDDGGTANGGDDTAPAQTFQITVSAVNDPPTADNESLAALCNVLSVVEAAPGEAADAGGVQVFRNVIDNVLVGDEDAVENTAIQIIQASGLPGGTVDNTAPFVITTDQGGTATLYTDGSFEYTPEAGDRSVNDSFTYTIQDADGGQATGTVSISVGDSCVWFVDNSVSATDDTGTGTSSDPFTSLVDEIGPDAAADDAEDASQAGDIIYVFAGDSQSGDAYQGGYVAEANERILGEGVDLVVDLGGGPETLFDSVANTKPQVDAGAAVGFAVTDVDGVEIAGFDIDSDVQAIQVSATAGIIATSIHDNSFDGGLGGLEATAGGGTLRLAVDDNTDIVSLTSGILLDGTGGTLTVTSFCGNTIHGDTAGDGISATNVVFDANPADADFTGDEVECSNGTVIGDVGNRVAGSGLLLDAVTGDLDLGPLSAWVGTGGGADEAALRVTSADPYNAAAGTGFQFTTDSGTLDSLDGPAVDMDPVDLETMVLTTVVSQNSDTFGVGLTEVSGSFVTNGGNSNITGAAGNAFEIVDTPAAGLSVTYDGDITNASAATLLVDGHPAGTVSFTAGTVGATGGTGLQFDDADGMYQITSAVTLNGGDAGLDITNGRTGSFNFPNTSITSPSGPGIRVANSSPSSVSFTGGGSLTYATAGQPAVLLQNRGAGTFTYSRPVSVTNGTGLRFDNNDGTTTTFNNTVTLNGGDAGIDIINGSSGSYTFSNTTITSPAGVAFNIESSSAGVTWSTGGITQTNSASAVRISSHSSGIVNLYAPITGNTGSANAVDLTGSNLGTYNLRGGLDLDTTTGTAFNATGGGTVNVCDDSACNGTGSALNNTVDVTGAAIAGVNFVNTNIGGSGVTFDTVNVDGAADGINLTQPGSGDFAALGGTIQNITARGVDVSGGTGDVRVDASIDTTTAGRSVEVTTHTGGTVDFNGFIDDDGLGIRMENNVGAILRFDGGMDVDTANAVAEEGFQATGGGTVHVTGTNDVSTSLGTGTAVNIASGTSIGSDGTTFRSVSASNGTTPGIVINGTGGSGSFTVTGNGGDCQTNLAQCSGGSILSRGANSNGIEFINTFAPSVSHMRVANNTQNGLYGEGINGLQILQSRFTDNADQASPDEAGIFLSNATGGALAAANETRIEEVLVADSHEHNVLVRNTMGTITNLFVDDSSFTNDGGSTEAGNHFFVDLSGTADVTVNVTNSLFDGNLTAGMLTAFGLTGDAADTSSLTLNAATSNFVDNNVALAASASQTGTVNFDFTNNPVITGSRSNAINIFANANHSGTITGTVDGNIVGTNGSLSSGSDFGVGVRIANEGSGTVTALIDGNTIQEVGDGLGNGFEGIFVNETVNGGTVNATITGNTVDQIRDDRGILVQQVLGGGTVCSDISGNTLTNISSGTPIRVRQSSGTHNVRQLDPAGGADPNRLDTANGGVSVSVAGTINFNSGACPQP